MKHKIKLALHELTEPKKIQKGKTILTRMTGNPHFATPPSIFAQLPTLVADAENDLYECRSLLAKLKSAYSRKDTSIAALCRGLTLLGYYVDVTSGGRADIALSAGMQVQNGRAPVKMTQVQKFRVTPSIREGELLARWKRVPGKTMYEVQISRDGTKAPTNWLHKLNTTKTKCALNHDLLSGEKVWVRVRAVGARNEGPWSNPVCKTVP